MTNHCDKMGTVPILLQQIFSHWQQSQRKLLILNSTIEILRTQKITVILAVTVAVAHCEWAFSPLARIWLWRPPNLVFFKFQMDGLCGIHWWHLKDLVS